MMTVQCPSCNKLYNIAETMAGKQVRCKACGTTFAIGAQEQPPQQQQYQAPEGQIPEDPGGGAAMRAAAGPGGKSVALIAGMAVGLAALAAVTWFVVVPMLSGGQPEWTKPLMPKGTKLVAHIDIESIRESKLVAKMEEMVKASTEGQTEDMDAAVKMLTGKLGLQSKLKFDDIDAVFVAASDVSANPPKLVVGLRVKSGMSLADLLSGPSVVKKKHKDKDYVAVSVGGPGGDMTVFVAKIDDETFCASPDETELKSALDRTESGQTVDLDEKLASIISTVSKKNTFVAVDPAAIPMIPIEVRINGFGFGLDVNGSIDAVVIVALKDSKTAENMADEANTDMERTRKNIRKGIEQGEEMLEKASGSRKEQMEKQLKIMKVLAGWLDDVRIKQSGNQVEITASIDTDELLEIFDQVKDMAGGLMGGMMGGR